MSWTLLVRVALPKAVKWKSSFSDISPGPVRRLLEGGLTEAGKASKLSRLFWEPLSPQATHTPAVTPPFSQGPHEGSLVSTAFCAPGAGWPALVLGTEPVFPPTRLNSGKVVSDTRVPVCVHTVHGEGLGLLSARTPGLHHVMGSCNLSPERRVASTGWLLRAACPCCGVAGSGGRARFPRPILCLSARTRAGSRGGCRAH